MKSYRVLSISLIILTVVGGSVSDVPICKDCGGILTARQSLIISPKYPENYPSSVCCDYTVRSPYLCPIDFHIQFLDFILEPSVNCSNDYLAIGADLYDANRNYVGDILCGHVTGSRKYRSPDGVLRMRFVTNDAVEGKGFRLLITRLSCEETMTTRYTTNNTSHENKDPVVTLPKLELLPPLQKELTDLTKQTNNHHEDVFQNEQYLPPEPEHLPNNPSYPFYPQSSVPLTPTNNGYLPPSEEPCPTPSWIPGNNNYNPQNTNCHRQQQLPPAGSCCVGSFQQQRLYLTSPGFPARADASPPRDCFYYMEKSGPNVCSLRVVFRFFALGSADGYSGQCLSDFIEIDGERMCGCRTGFVYTAEWGLGAKVIRLRTNGRLSGTASIGFILDVAQENCGVRHLRQVGALPHAIVETNSVTRTKFYIHDRREEQPRWPEDGLNSNLIFAQSNRCEFGFADLLRLSFDALWLTRPRC